ncbi:hypothetical protein V6N13_125240 [Hibiscus sabdariffa]
MGGTFSDLSIARKSSYWSRFQHLGYLPNLVFQRLKSSFLVLHPHLCSVHESISFLDELVCLGHIGGRLCHEGVECVLQSSIVVGLLIVLE